MDNELKCGYEHCGGNAVGYGIHENAWHSGADIVIPVCERHKGWEIAKLVMDRGDSIYM